MESDTGADVTGAGVDKIRVLIAKPGLDGHDRAPKWWRGRCATQASR